MLYIKSLNEAKRDRHLISYVIKNKIIPYFKELMGKYADDAFISDAERSLYDNNIVREINIANLPSDIDVQRLHLKKIIIDFKIKKVTGFEKVDLSGGYSVTNEIIYIDIKYNIKDFKNYIKSLQFFKIELRVILAHELIHAMGYPGASTNTSDLKTYYLAKGEVRATVSGLYNLRHYFKKTKTLLGLIDVYLNRIKHQNTLSDSFIEIYKERLIAKAKELNMRLN